MNDDLHGAATTIADEIHTIDVRIEGLTERRLHLTRALDELRLLGLELDNEPATPPAPADRVEKQRTAASSATTRTPKKKGRDSRGSGVRTTADRVASMSAAAAIRVICDRCGLSFSQLGLGPHRRGCKPDGAPFTKEPITKVSFDPDKVRAETAGPIETIPKPLVDSVPSPRKTAAAAAPPRALKFTVDDARDAIGATA